MAKELLRNGLGYEIVVRSREVARQWGNCYFSPLHSLSLAPASVFHLIFFQMILNDKLMKTFEHLFNKSKGTRSNLELDATFPSFFCHH